MKVGKPNEVESQVILEFSRKRKELGYSYEKMAELTGLHRTTISLVERQKIHPTLLVSLKMADALKLKLSDLVP